MPPQINPQALMALLMGQRGTQQPQPTEDPEMAAIRAKLAELQQIGETPAPPPVAEQPINPLQRIGLTAADALTAYAQGLNPGIRSLDALESLRRRRAQRAREQTALQQQGFQQSQEGRRARTVAEAELLMGERSRKLGDKKKTAEDERERRIALENAAGDLGLESPATMSDQALRDAIAGESRRRYGVEQGREAFKTKLEERRTAATESQAESERMRAEKAADKDRIEEDRVLQRELLREQREGAATVRGGLSILKTAAKTLTVPRNEATLADGTAGQPLTTADIREKFEDTIAAQGIDDPRLLRELRGRFEEMIEPILMKHEADEMAKDRMIEAEEREKARRKQIREQVQGKSNEAMDRTMRRVR